MMNQSSKPSTLEWAIYTIIVLVGVLAIVFADSQVDSFSKDLLLNVGSDLIVVTIIFIVFQIFRRRREEIARSDGAKNNSLQTDDSTGEPSDFPSHLEGVLQKRSTTEVVVKYSRRFDDMEDKE